MTMRRPLSYDDALHRLLSLADYERMAGRLAPAPKYNLDRMRELAERLGQPQDTAPVLHVAGTKGKGSIAAMASSILHAAGLRVGLFTSPHLHTFRERIRIDGDLSTGAQFASALARVWPHVEEMAARGTGARPTTFEALTAMAFDLFRTESVDAAVIEVGLGGRLDATNVLDARVCVIAPISLDHTAILGDTVAQVAAEKAGIVKSPAPVVTGPQPPEALEVIERAAAAAGAPLVRVGHEVTVEGRAHDLSGQTVRIQTAARVYDARLPLLGAHQAENAAVAVAAVEALGMGLPEQAYLEGLATVRWDGRFQLLGSAPYVVVDGAHNPSSMSRLCETVRDYVAPERTVVLFGCSADKDLDAMVAELVGTATSAVVCASRHPRAVRPERVAEAFRRAGVEAVEAPNTPDVGSALRAAQAQAGPADLVLVTGSLFVVAEALEAWFSIPGEHYPEFDPQAAVVTRGPA